MISSNATVLLADFTRKKIRDLEIGDQLIDADLNICRVTLSQTESYKNRLRILSFKSNLSFCFAESSTFFVKQDKIQTFWVEHPAVLLFQMSHLKINSSAIRNINNIAGKYSAEFATIDDFKQQSIVDVTEKYLDQNNLWLTRIETDSFAPIIVEDFLYIPVVNDVDYNYNQLNWDQNLQKLRNLLK
jgi:hypothetical protein